MTDRRSTPDPALLGKPAPAQIASPHADLLAQPNGARDRQLLLGDPVTVLGELDGHSYIRSDKDSYIGFVRPEHLAPPAPPTHMLTAPAGHAYSAPDLKSPETAALCFGAQMTALSETADHLETALGHVPKAQTAPLPYSAPPGQTAQHFLGAPYLWGGNTRAGIDCSGLVQIALRTAGVTCPADSDQQEQAFTQIEPDERQAGDLVFWKGHVALLLSPDTVIHANAHHMAVALEPFAVATARIAQKEFGDITSLRRPDYPHHAANP